MMPFCSSLSKYVSDEMLDLEGSGGSLNSFEVITSTGNYLNHPLLSEREAIKIRAQSVIDRRVDAKTMSIDPNITSFASLYLLLKKAFDLSSDFDISYLLPKSPGNAHRPDIYLSLTSDWDLDAAFHTASYPMLILKVSPVPKEDVTTWDVVENSDAPLVKDIKSNSIQLPFSLSLKHEMSRKFTKVLDVFAESNRRSLLSEKEWVEYFDDNGRIISHKYMRIRVFHSGLSNSLRKQAWVHLLGVYPSDLSSEERRRFIFMKTQVYKHLKENWLARFPQEIDEITHMVQKDVLRTDRNHPFFSVAEDHPNMVSLFNILTTYALNNPEISYCQGMSDLAAPLLVVTQDETLAYLCFCKVMQRLRSNFLLKGAALLGKFGQLSLLLQYADKEFYDYLQEVEMGSLYFCYRMLLLELKREFPFNENLLVMEMIWSSLPPEGDDEESELSFYYALIQNSKHASERNSPNSECFCNQPAQNDELEPLPHPRYLNDGSPFPLFLCLAILMESRDNIILGKMDYGMVAMYFDKLSRRHDSSKIIARGKALFFEYLRSYLDGQTIHPSNSNHLTIKRSSNGTAAQC